MSTKSLTEDDVSLICLALRIAEKQFRADAVTVGAMHVGKLVTQFERQAERATALATRLEDAESVRVIPSYDREDTEVST